MGTDMHYGAEKIIFQYADDLRKNMTETEKILWKRVRKNQLSMRIRRQHPIDNYIADFYCHELKLVIEIDGGIHLSKETSEYDIIRDLILNGLGIVVIRFTNHQVTNEIEQVIAEIQNKIAELK